MQAISEATIQRAQSGDTQALTDLIAAHQTYVYSIALGIMHNPADAADATQDAFLKVVRSLHTYRGETKFTTWLYRLVANVCFDELRRKSHKSESLNAGWDDEGESNEPMLLDADRWGQPEESTQIRESAKEVRAALEQLTPTQRLALTLFYFQDLSDRDIAAVMDLPVNTVKSHIHRGKARLVQILGGARPAAVKPAVFSAPRLVAAGPVGDRTRLAAPPNGFIPAMAAKAI
jgi:RNA polymerase sigma-70 factor (ECF subfamily)